MAHEPEICDLCGRNVRYDPKTPGCYWPTDPQTGARYPGCSTHAHPRPQPTKSLCVTEFDRFVLDAQRFSRKVDDARAVRSTRVEV